MKDNCVPTLTRLNNMLNKLIIKHDNCWDDTVYYPHCIHCNITNVQASIDGDHYVGCQLRGIDKQISYWEGLINEQQSR
jgi:hypothetical protein